MAVAAALAPAAQAQTFPPPGSIAASANWAGYAASNAYYTHVTALLEAPTPDVLQVTGRAASWVGIGGWASNDLIQAGIVEAQAGDLYTYRAWYEMLPNPPVNIELPLQPGAWVLVDIRELRFNLWQISVVNGASVFQQQFMYASSHSSAEWILEAPAVVKNQSIADILPLSGVAGANFAKLGATANGVDAVPAQLFPSATGIAFGPIKAAPTTIGPDGATFSVVTAPA